MIAFEELELLREERRMLEEQEATKIAAVWRSYYIRTGYVIVLKGMRYLLSVCAYYSCLSETHNISFAPFYTAARKHEQRYTAASIVQAQWRAYSSSRSFVEMKTHTIQIQSVIRMMLATKSLKLKKSKLEEAANYHKDDYFAYSKKRKAAAIKIQAMYRMIGLRRKYLEKKMEKKRLRASGIIQSAYRTRYSDRMNRATKKPKSSSSKPIFDDGGLDCFDVEVELGQDPSQYHVKDCFVSAKKRRAAYIHIQAVFRGHLGRQSAKKTKRAFALSEQRRVAAEKIQNAYRKHLFRTTCHFRSVPSTPTDQQELQLVLAGTDFLAMIMSMITG
jgi:hypothetical protein